MSEEIKVICPHRITGLCSDPNHYKKCGHGYFHKPIQCSGATCRTRTGVCSATDFIVNCESLHGKRQVQLEGIINNE